MTWKNVLMFYSLAKEINPNSYIINDKIVCY